METLNWRHARTKSPIKWHILENWQCNEHRKVILVAHLLQDYGNIIYYVKEQFHLVIMRYDVELRLKPVCVELCLKGVTVRNYMNVGKNCAITQALHIGYLYIRHLYIHNTYPLPGDSWAVQQTHKLKHSKSTSIFPTESYRVLMVDSLSTKEKTA